MQLDGTAARGPCHPELPCFVKQLAGTLVIPARRVEHRRPYEDTRQQRLLVQRARGRDRPLRQRDAGIPVTARERVLDAQLIEVDSKQRRPQILGQTLCALDVLQHLRAVTRESRQRRKPMMRGPGDGLVPDLLRQLERLLAMSPRTFGWSG